MKTEDAIVPEKFRTYIKETIGKIGKKDARCPSIFNKRVHHAISLIADKAIREIPQLSIFPAAEKAEIREKIIRDSEHRYILEATRRGF